MHDSKPFQVGLIGAGFNTGNMGVGALAAGSVRCIRQQWPTAEIFLLDYAHQPSTHRLRIDSESLTLPLLNLRFSKKFYLSNNIALLLLMALAARLLPSRTLRQRVFSGNQTLRKIVETDVFTAIAGGDSFSDIYGLRRFLYVTLPQILIILIGRPLILLPQTFGPFRTAFARRICAFIARHAEAIYARDDQSVAIVSSLMGKGPRRASPVFRYDVGFALQPNAPAAIDIEGSGTLDDPCVVGLNVSGLLQIGGYDRANMFGLRADYKELLESVLDYFILEARVPVLLVPHVFGDNRVAESDVLACEALYKACHLRHGHRLGFLRGRYDQGELKHIIGTCDFFLGSRMHACIAAVSQSVPTVAIAYSDKFIGVMQSVGMPSVVADARKLDIPQLMEHIRTMYETRRVTRAQLERRMPLVVNAALTLFERSPVSVLDEAAIPRMSQAV